MIKSTLIYVFVLLISNLCLGRNIQSIKSGKWKDLKTWKNGVTPSLSDSVIINQGDTVFINSSSARCFYINNKGVIFFKSSTNAFNCSKVSFDGGEVTGNSLGLLHTETIFFGGNSILGKCHLEVSKATIIKDSLLITSSSGIKQLGSVTNNGTIINIASEDINLNGNFKNKGIIKFNNGSFIFSGPAVVSGSLSLMKLKLVDSLIIKDTITVTEEIVGKGKLINKGVVQLGMTDSKFKIDSINLGFPNNELHLIRKGRQTIPRISNNKAEKIVFRGEGVFNMSQYLKVGTIEIRNNSSLEISSKTDVSSIICLDSSKLLTSNDFYLTNINDLIFEENSTLQIKNNQKLKKSIQIGNLIIDNSIILTLNNHEDTLRISGDFSGYGILNGNPVIEYNGKSRQFIKKRNYSKLIYNNSSINSSTFYGNNSIENLEIKKGKLKVGDLKVYKCQIDSLGQLIIGGNAPVFIDTTQISGSLIINSNEAHPKFNFLAIRSNGIFNNNSSSDIIISNGVSNDGLFSGCLGTACDYIFLNDSAFFSGKDTVFIPRIEAKKVYNKGIVFVRKKINIDSLFNLPKGILVLATDTQNTSGIMDFTARGNKLVFNKKGNQKTPISLSHVHHLVFQNSGNKSISSHLSIDGDLEIKEHAFLKTDSFQITGKSSGSISIDSLSSLSLGHNYSAKPIEFPLNFSRIFCHDSSLVIYGSQENQTIDSKPHYGNLTIDDGAIDSCKKNISGDSLIVKGNLILSESSVTLAVKNKTVDLDGNWNGPGNIDLTTGTFHIGGDGNSDGKINEGKSEFVYDGSGPQKIKIGNYYNLTIDKTGRAYTKANKGSLLVKNKAWIKNGNLDFNSERCHILNLNIDDSVSFSSKYQEKHFKNILVNPTGVFLLDYEEEIYISGNIECHGSFVCKRGKTFFTDSVKTQKINGFGEIKMGKIVLCKKSTYLEIYSDLTLTDTLLLEHGKIELNSEMKLESLGYIQGETSKYPITGFGKIYGNTLIKKGVYENIKGLGITLITKSPMGETLIERTFKTPYFENNKGINRAYTIKPSLISNLDVTMCFNYWDSELNGNIEDELTLLKSSDFGNTWKKKGGIVNTTINSITLKGITSFSKWTAGTPALNVLAVELLSFEALRQNDGSIFIDWEVLTELKTKAYQINYSFDGIEYDSLTRCNATNSMNYNFTWYDAPNQTIFFELVEIEIDSNTSSLDTTLVYPLIGREPEVWISKNKIHTKFFPTGTINVFNIRGKLISHNSFDISKLPFGVYYIELLNEIGRWTFEFTKY